MIPRNLDLNLLVVFDALMKESSVTRAAARLGLSQPAVSEALARLRSTFKDELFIRSSHGMTPTRRALELSDAVARALSLIRGALSGDVVFDPRTSVQAFSVAASDYAEVILLPALAASVLKAAPGVSIRAIAATPRAALDLVDRGEADFAIDVFPRLTPKRFARTALLTERAVCLARRGHPGISRKLELRTYLAASHVVRSLKGETGRSVVDRALKARRLKRRIALTVTNVLAIPFALAKSDFIATQPSRVSRLLARTAALAIYEPPFDIPGWSVDFVCARKRLEEAPLRWMRRLLVETAAKL